MNFPIPKRIIPELIRYKDRVPIMTLDILKSCMLIVIILQRNYFAVYLVGISQELKANC